MVSHGLEQTASTSLEVKAAILGATYALEQFFSKSGQAGTNLTNFNALTGVSTQTLQQYQYAARQAGVSNEQTAATFLALQNSMTKLRQGEAAPKGFVDVARLTGGFSSGDVDKFMQNPDLLLQKLQVYAQKQKNVGVRNDYLKSFGLDESTIAALSRGAFATDKLKKASTYSEREVQSLDKANIAWSNLNNQFQMAIGHFNALHGQQLVKDASIMIDVVLKLASALVNLADKIHFFEILGKGFNEVGQAADAIMPIFFQFGNALGSLSKNGTFINDIGRGFAEIEGDAASAAKFILEIGAAFTQVAQQTGTLGKLVDDFQMVESIASDVLTIIENIGSAVSQDLGLNLVGSFQAVEAVVKTINLILEGWGEIFSGIKSATSFAANLSKPGEGPAAKEVVSNLLPSSQDIMGWLSGHPKEMNDAGVFNSTAIKDMTTPTVSPAAVATQKALQQSVDQSTSSSAVQNINVDQTLNFQGNGQNAQDAAAIHRKAIENAFRQLPSQIQGS